MNDAGIGWLFADATACSLLLTSALMMAKPCIKVTTLLTYTVTIAKWTSNCQGSKKKQTKQQQQQQQ